ncbi:glycosyl transferase, partial [Pseudomonas aeruginosa]
MSIWWILFPVVLVSAGLTGVLRFYAISKKVMDIPNARSSHTVPTPRGGGVAIVLTFLLVVFFLPLFSILEWRQALLFLLGGGGVALLGFLDDHGHVAARWRLLGHFMAALVSLFLLTGVPPFK